MSVSPSVNKHNRLEILKNFLRTTNWS